MNIKPSTLAHRRRFNIAAQHLRDDREEFFRRNGRRIITRLRNGGCQALRDITIDLREGGIYSKSIPLCSAEVMVMKKLHRLFNDRELEWANFVRDTVGTEWFRGIREVRYTHIKYVRR